MYDYICVYKYIQTYIINYKTVSIQKCNMYVFFISSVLPNKYVFADRHVSGTRNIHVNHTFEPFSLFWLIIMCWLMLLGMEKGWKGLLRVEVGLQQKSHANSLLIRLSGQGIETGIAGFTSLLGSGPLPGFFCSTLN